MNPAQLPSEYRPRKVADFIGPARAVAHTLDHKVRRIKDRPAAQKYLLYGPPGSGKSELANFLAAQLAGHDTDIERVNGQNIRVELVRKWIDSMRYTSLFGGHRVLIWNELDKASPDAQDLVLSMLDELPPHMVVIGTSNLDISLLMARFQTRFQQYQVSGASMDEIRDFLIERFGCDETLATNIAFGSGGNVRAALLDLETAQDVEAAGTMRLAA